MMRRDAIRRMRAALYSICSRLPASDTFLFVAATTLETALEDPDIRVRQMAAELLDELELILMDEEERQSANE